MKVKKRLVACIILLCLFLGFLSGFIIKNTAKLRARLDRETYQIIQKNEYKSVKYEGDSSFLFEFTLFNIMKDYSFVIVEKEQGEVISERFYNVLGDAAKVSYRDTGSVTITNLSTPLYTTTCLIPLILGFFGSFVFPCLFLETIQKNVSESVQNIVDYIIYYSFHLFYAGIFSYFFFFVFPLWLSLFSSA